MTEIQSCESLRGKLSLQRKEQPQRPSGKRRLCKTNKQRPVWLESREQRESGMRQGQEGGLGQTIDLVGHDRLILPGVMECIG